MTGPKYRKFLPFYAVIITIINLIITLNTYSNRVVKA